MAGKLDDSTCYESPAFVLVPTSAVSLRSSYGAGGEPRPGRCVPDPHPARGFPPSTFTTCTALACHIFVAQCPPPPLLSSTETRSYASGKSICGWLVRLIVNLVRCSWHRSAAVRELRDDAAVCGVCERGACLSGHLLCGGTFSGVAGLPRALLRTRSVHGDAAGTHATYYLSTVVNARLGEPPVPASFFKWEH